MAQSFAESFPARLAALCKLAAEKCELTLPEDSEALIRAILTSTGPKDSKRWRMLSRPRKTATQRERALHALYEWHAGQRGYSIWTAMMWNHVDGYDEIDSLAHMLVLVLLRRTSAPGQAWSKALGTVERV